MRVPYVKKRREKDDISNRTLRRDLDALSSHFQWLQAEGRVDHNRVRDYDTKAGLPELKEEIRVPTVREIQSVIDAMHRMLASLTAWQALTGMRQAEAIFAEWADVDLAAGTITVPKSKTSSPRIIHLFQSALELLRSLPKPPNHDTHPRGGYVFWHDGGRAFEGFASTYRRIVHDLLGLTPRDHDLRHFFAWLYLRRGGKIAALKSQMGHKKIETTEQYAHIADDLAHFDLVVMGDRPAVANPEQFDVRFNFEKSGPFVDGAELHARSVRRFAEIRAAQFIAEESRETPEQLARRAARDKPFVEALTRLAAEAPPRVRVRMQALLAEATEATTRSKTGSGRKIGNRTSPTAQA
jgi:integrase